MEQVFLYLVPFLGLIGLLVMAIKSAWVSKQPSGEQNMVELASFIARGAMSFLRAEWKVMIYFVIIAAIILGWSGTLLENSSPVIAIAFLIGAGIQKSAIFLTGFNCIYYIKYFFNFYIQSIS